MEQKCRQPGCNALATHSWRRFPVCLAHYKFYEEQRNIQIMEHMDQCD